MQLSATDIHVLFFGTRVARLPAGAWLSGLTLARAEPRCGVRIPAGSIFFMAAMARHHGALQFFGVVLCCGASGLL